MAAPGHGGLDLVTGGAGFIGSHLAEALVAAGRRVRVVDDLSTGRRGNLGALPVDFLEGDLSDPALAEQACAGVERAFHLAARPSVPWSVAHPDAARRANLGTTLALAGAAHAAGVQRVVFSSTCAVYGDRGGSPNREDQAPVPASPYAEHKLAGEMVLLATAQQGGPGAVSLRYFNVYGPRQDPSSPYSGVVSVFVQRALAGAAATVFGDGEQTRDFVHVSDVVRANLLAAELEIEEPATAVNVASGRSVSVLELWRAVCTAAGAGELPVTHEAAREGDLRHSRADVARAEERLGFRAELELPDGLRETLAAGPLR